MPMLKKLLKIFCFVILTAFFCLNNHLSADIDVLKRIAKAEQGIGYVGLRLRTFGSRTMEEIVIHKTPEASYRKVESIVGEQKPLDEDRPAEKKPDDKARDNDRGERRRSREFRWDRQRNQFSTKEIELIAKNYTLERRLWGEKIAGYETDILIIKPKHVGRPAKYIYYARKNGVILKVQDLDAAGVLRGMFVYTRISFNPETVASKWEKFQGEIKPEPRRDRSILLAEAKKILKTKPVQPKYLPPGFQLERVDKHQFGDNPLIRLKYTDGLLDFNIFEMTGKLERRGNRNRGTAIQIGDISVRKYTSGPTHVFRWSNAGIHFLLSGSIPATEMQKVVESIVHKTDQK